MFNWGFRLDYKVYVKNVIYVVFGVMLGIKVSYINDGFIWLIMYGNWGLF